MQPETDPKTNKLSIPQIFSHWKPGDTILDSYCVEDVISTGGMGRIYVTNHVLWKVKVAIKSPRGEMLIKKHLYARIAREADAWTNLGLHPHIAYCYFVRAIEDVPHLFVEYVDGGNLRKWIEEGRCADFEIALDLAIQFCHGMAHAHSKGMIHRDIKPENILMTKDGILKITDFGIARWGEEDDSLEDSSLTDDMKTIGFIGTRAYASPEQLMDAHTVGPETDIFSFGVCLWEMLLGQRPYVLAIKELPLPDPKRLRANLPDQFSVLLTDLVAYERESRRKIGGFAPLKDRLESIYQELLHKPSPHRNLEKIDLKADGLNNRGASYMELGKEADALCCFQQAINADHQHLEATFNYYYLQWQRGQITNDVLVASLKQLEPSKGSNPDYWRYLAWLHLERGDVEAIEKIQFSKNRITEPDFLRAYADPNKPLAKMVWKFEGHKDMVFTVAFFPDGRHALSWSIDNNLILWDVATGRKLKRLEDHFEEYDSDDMYNVFTFSPNLKYGLGCDSLMLWDVATGSVLRRFNDEPTSRITSACFSTDEMYALSGDYDGILRLWAVAPGKEVRKFYGHTDTIYSVCFSSDGRYALSGSKDETVRLWDVAAGKEVRRFNGHTGTVYSVCFSPDGKYALSEGDGTLKYWQVANGDEVWCVMPGASCDSIAFSPNGKYILVMGTVEMCIGLWEVATGKHLRTFEGHTDLICSVCFSPDGRYALSGSMDKTVRFWDVSTGKELRRFEGHTNHVRSVCFSPDARFVLSGCSDKTLRLWDMASGRELRRFEGHTRMVNSVCFSPDGRYALSSSEDETCRLWEVTSGKELQVEGTIEFRGFYLNGLLSGRADDIHRFWDIATGKYLQRFEEQLGIASSYRFLFSPDGRYALIADGDDIILWEFDWEWVFFKDINGYT